MFDEFRFIGGRLHGAFCHDIIVVGKVIAYWIALVLIAGNQRDC